MCTALRSRLAGLRSLQRIHWGKVGCDHPSFPTLPRGQRGRMGKGPEPVPIRIISRIDGKDLGQDGSVMGTLRFAHPTGLHVG
ncbi:MAG: hypothetical protein LVS60_09600 [Nodosilinea sp. LVE1205-7]